MDYIQLDHLQILTAMQEITWYTLNKLNARSVYTKGRAASKAQKGQSDITSVLLFQEQQ